jgi:hypothetical protein
MSESEAVDIIHDQLLPTSFITADRDLTDRGLRKQISRGAFPAPDANIGGKNFWRASTYRKWKVAALAGEFARATPVIGARQAAA